MATESYHLSVGGPKLVVLNCSEAYAPLHEYVPSNKSPILQSSWSSNGTCLASCVRHSDKVVMTYSKRNVFSSAEIATGLSQPLAVVFPRSTQRKLFVGNNCKVILYDIAKKKAAKEFEVKEPLSCLDISVNDQYLGAGCKRGSLFLLNNMTNQTSPPLKTVEADEITAVHFCHGYKSRLASCNDAGSVNLWDCNASKVLKTFREHTAPSTGLASFPFNDLLLLSSGLDKKCVGYDVKSGETCSTLKTDYPLTSVEALLNGNSIALGTSNGKVLIYDLRSFNKPLKIVPCQSGAVRSLVCQPPPETPRILRSQPSSTKVKLSNFETSSSLKENIPSSSPDLLRPLEETTTTTGMTKQSSTPDLGRDSIGSQVFSPLKQAGVSSPAMSVQSLGSHYGQNNASNLSVNNISHDSLFSPLRDNNSIHSPLGTMSGDMNLSSNVTRLSVGNNSGVFIPKTPIGSFNKSSGTPLISPLTMIREEDTLEHDKIAARLSHSFIQASQPSPKKFTHASKPTLVEVSQCETLPTGSSTAFQQSRLTSSTPAALLASNLEGQTRQVVRIDDEDEEDEDEDENHESERPVDDVDSYDSSDKNNYRRTSKTKGDGGDIKAIMTAFPRALMETQQYMHDSADELVQRSAQIADQRNGKESAGHEIDSVFQQKFMRSCVEEAMDEFCSEMRQQMWHMQYDTIRAFQLQKEEMGRLLRSYAVNEALLSENQRLKQENETLRNYF
ncbi:hypothetical protein TCAL_02373, partial [Tigriopus californicus]|eukprot:TCALIF_02373-PA protein Name:"Similar to Nedd1 Protein NEDD1 (Mus musculus)" AED:0.08 eAED:0.08 QI:205/1/0.66/1/0.5/0.33/3/0/728